MALAKGMGMSVARYPGGCGVHLFDWKKAIGPASQRPGQQFGLPEFLRTCAAVGAEPLIAVADYAGTAQDAAELVEYLNAPDDGRHPWAARRAADDHAAPWGVVWFEYGNETEHGAHRGMDDIGRGRKLSPREYARNYLAYRRVLRAVDRKVKLGAVLVTGFPDLDDWARPVLEVAGHDLDFVVHHCYLPNYQGNDGKPEARELFALALAVADQVQDYYDRVNTLLVAVTGRRDMPIAVTEFNGGFIQEKGVPYRHTLGNALVNTELLRVLMRPGNHIVLADVWQFANESGGAVKDYAGRGKPRVKRPQY